MEIGKQIKKYRTEMKFSQDELAEKIFVSRQTISNWENNKNYPDVKSLLLLSSLFNVSLDILIKGDLEEMKEKIKSEDIINFKNDGNIFSILLLCTILLPVPLVKFMGNIGGVIWGVIAIGAIYYAIRVEKYKKNFDIQTYREILSFLEGKNMDELQKNQEYGKRPYQKFLLATGAALLAILVSVIMVYILL
ncbi:helix-turn-helix domain-containing protein [Clostridium perfringens]|uniref:DNA-binding helix-turn-helix protein n=2 Tax=Clostridium perfringens TaxID=1502 RepID=A0A133NAB0_CLOPF|nr:helix-turn-helix transcriptional regulator [Clostridium perfringens]EGT3601301.1 helix-turn-helix transcriptional regulator [Clostridium perfringens]ELC8361222.1 helix-turn-helix transcriptional regulator [Clostridium perfringens]KXA13227.1 DNA-binding helix-turn-helix protein [Clostridium perfringens]MBS5922243.1 helix-turn-helix transcriptional regulator [Clostridium perfringens]MDM0469142.1 helix-turn-helix transcriptional regulator [Clostridium perfringens]